ncbi:hypothetical protein [Tessaracoccus flavescens]|nr:hypothetical protein [Tessaracoccus flavescens]
MKRVEAVVIGAGQAGLSAAYHLQRLGIGSSSSTPTSAPAERGSTAGTR